MFDGLVMNVESSRITFTLCWHVGVFETGLPSLLGIAVKDRQEIRSCSQHLQKRLLRHVKLAVPGEVVVIEHIQNFSVHSSENGKVINDGKQWSDHFCRSCRLIKVEFQCFNCKLCGRDLGFLCSGFRLR